MLRLQTKKYCYQLVHLSIGYSRQISGGFSKRITLSHPTDLTESVFEACLMLFEKGYRGHPIRKVAIQVGQLSTRGQMQLSLFEDVTKRQPVTYTMDEIRLKYGKSVL